MSLRAVLRDEHIVLPSTEGDKSTGGYVRKPAPCNGFYDETSSQFFTKAQIQDALVELKMLERDGRPRRKRFVGRGLVP